MDKNGPFIISSSEIKYQNPWITVKEDKIKRLDGKPGIFGTVTMQAGVSMLPIDNQGFVYLTSEFRYAIKINSIESVSGGINTNEKPLQCAKRELKEELGIKAKSWINLGFVNPFTSLIDSPAYLFLAKDLSFSQSQQDGNEKIDQLKIKFEKAVEMVMKSKITHGPSCVLILKAQQYLSRASQNK